MKTAIVYALAALGEIAGCFSFWAWLRLGKSPLWVVPGMVSLALFAYLLTLVESSTAGRAYRLEPAHVLLAVGVADRVRVCLMLHLDSCRVVLERERRPGWHCLTRLSRVREHSSNGLPRQ